MTNEDKILEKLTDMENRLNAIQRSIEGDRFSQPKLLGILDFVDMLHREIHGDETTKSKGLKELWLLDHDRIKALQNDRLKIISWCAGASAAVGALVAYAKSKLFGS